VIYISPTGVDNATCGSLSNPMQTPMYAAKAIQTANGDGTDDGGIIYCLAGTYQLGTYSFGLLTTTTNRWLTIMPAPGLTRADVSINGSVNTDGLRTKLVHLKNVTITAPISSGQDPSYLWLDQCVYNGGNRATDLNIILFPNWTDIYVTDGTATNSKDGFTSGRGAAIVRNCLVDTISAEAFEQVGLLDNCVCSNIDPAPWNAANVPPNGSLHPDSFQSYPGLTGNIIRGLKATSGVIAQGIFAGNNIPWSNVAVVNCNVHTSFGTARAGISLGGACVNVYIKDSSFGASTEALKALREHDADGCKTSGR